MSRRILPHQLTLMVLAICAVPWSLARAETPATATLDEATFRTAIRPMFQRAGCASPICHGSGLIAMRLGTALRDDAFDLPEVTRYLRIGDPDGSAVLHKALGEVHLGGRNLATDSCEAKLLAGWIRGTAGLAACPTPSEPKAEDGLPLALRDRLASCASPDCHGGKAAPRMLPPSHPSVASVDAQALRPFVDRFLPSRSKLLHAMLGEHGHPRSVKSTTDRAYLDVLAWIATGSGGGALPRGTLPSYDVFRRDIAPILDRRGCEEGGCHGAGGVSLTLMRAAPSDNYVRLLARVAAGTFPAKPKNVLPHGGGKRLGDAMDCATTTIDAWLAGRAPSRCKKAPPPDRKVFDALVQPALETLTCPRCHAQPGLDFLFTGNPSAVELARNYKQVLAHVDLEYPPASRVLARVNEPCMQARLMAWVGRDPDPGCTVSLANFRGRFPGTPAPKTR